MIFNAISELMSVSKRIDHSWTLLVLYVERSIRQALSIRTGRKSIRSNLADRFRIVRSARGEAAKFFAQITLAQAGIGTSLPGIEAIEKENSGREPGVSDERLSEPYAAGSRTHEFRDAAVFRLAAWNAPE